MADTEEKTTQNTEQYQYQAEVQQLLNILIHSVYSEKEIFLRELISNAVDALNKIHFETLTNDDIMDKDLPLEIKVDLNEESKTITITDTGIGMTKQEVIENIGTIARSGSRAFLEKIKEAQTKDQSLQLIGQFGVGFYSVFMVAEQVTIHTRSYKKEEEAVQWISKGDASYTIAPSDKSERGTTIEIKLNDDAKEFSEQHRVESVIRQHSNYLPYPIKVKDNVVNAEKTLWTQPKSELKDEDYKEFYKSLSFSMTDPLTYFHFHVDAPIQFYAVLYIPDDISKEMLFTTEQGGIDLYAKKVFIEDHSHDILPNYLRFIRGVLDSEDLPLSISREVVQKTPLLQKISRNLTSKVLGELKTLSENEPETYKKFWKTFGVAIKEGLTQDFNNKEKLLELVRFNTSLHESAEELSSLDEIVESMKPDQEELYYVWGLSREAIEKNPNLEYFKKNGFTVLYLTDPVDEFHMQSLNEYKEKKLVSIEHAKVDESQKSEERPISEEETQSVLSFFKDILGDQVADVRESNRLVDSPCSIVADEQGMSGSMERIVKMMNKDFQSGKKIFEINPKNSIIQHIAKRVQEKDVTDSLKNQALLLFDGAQVMAGLKEEPQDMVDRMYRMMNDVLT
jgi:HSP90 family molecular chaperone